MEFELRQIAVVSEVNAPIAFRYAWRKITIRTNECFSKLRINNETLVFQLQSSVTLTNWFFEFNLIGHLISRTRRKQKTEYVLLGLQTFQRSINSLQFDAHRGKLVIAFYTEKEPIRNIAITWFQCFWTD